MEVSVFSGDPLTLYEGRSDTYIPRGLYVLLNNLESSDASPIEDEAKANSSRPLQGLSQLQEMADRYKYLSSMLCPANIE